MRSLAVVLIWLLVYPSADSEAQTHTPAFPSVSESKGHTVDESAPPRTLRFIDSELFNLLEPNYFLTGFNPGTDQGCEPFSQPDNQVHFRIAVRYRVLGVTSGLLDRMFGQGEGRTTIFDTGVHLGYVQNSFWNLWSSNNSRPFVDNNYSPRLFIYLDGMDAFGPHLGETGRYRWYYPSLRVDLFHHESNGRDGPASRTWDRFTTTLEFGDYRRNRLYGSLSGWKVYGGLQGNEGIRDTNGRGELRLYWQPLLEFVSEDAETAGLEYFGFSFAARLGGLPFVPSWEAAAYWNPAYGWGITMAPTLMAKLYCGTGQYLLHSTRDQCSFRLGIAVIR